MTVKGNDMLNFSLEELKSRFREEDGFCVREKSFPAGANHSGHMASAVCFGMSGDCTYEFGDRRYNVSEGEVLGLPGGYYKVSAGTEPVRQMFVYLLKVATPSEKS